MQTLRIDVESLRRDPVARGIVARWRALTGGGTVRDRDRRTLAACSGGADSTALVLALTSASDEVVVAHVVHDLRPRVEAGAERDRVRELAAGLGRRFVEAVVAVREMPGNAEGNARRERYRQLERLARESGCPFVATAHHAGDQLETMLMALVRGAGARGMAGMPARRRLGERGIRLVRPMLGVSRAEVEALCAGAGAPWSTDPTNADLSRLRAAVRAGPAAALASLRPGALAGAGVTAANLREVASLVASLGTDVLGEAERVEGGFRWPREGLRRAHPAVLAEAIRAAHAEMHAGRHGDRLPARSLRTAVAVIRSDSGEARRFVWRASELLVGSDHVIFRRAGHG